MKIGKSICHPRRQLGSWLNFQHKYHLLSILKGRKRLARHLECQLSHSFSHSILIHSRPVKVWSCQCNRRELPTNQFSSLQIQISNLQGKVLKYHYSLLGLQINRSYLLRLLRMETWGKVLKYLQAIIHKKIYTKDSRLMRKKMKKGKKSLKLSLSSLRAATPS